jgi:hypothetical protein
MTTRQQEVKKIFDRCKKFGMKAPDEFWNTPVEELAEIYNGAGPDWFPKWARWIVTLFLRIFKSPVMIHDWRFDRSDKLRSSFNETNEEFKHNMAIEIKARFSGLLWTPVRRFWERRAWLAYQACVLGGWSAWID